MQPKLSFIVPIYKVEDYLCKCVDSLLAQDLPSSEYEIILVDDGSPDGCPAICDEYAASYDNIRVIHQENKGLSAARNTGIAAAKGEYINFVDSDDYWEENVLGELMEQVERDKLDVLRFDYQNVRVVDAERRDTACLDAEHSDAVHLEYEVFEPNKKPRYIDKSSEVEDGETYLNTRMGYACYAVMYIIKRSLLAKDEGMNGLKDECFFKEGIHFEDVEWLPRMMLSAQRVNSTTTTVYNYLVRQGSITKTQGDRSKILKNLEDRLTIIEQYSTYRKTYPNCKWLYNMQSNMAAGVLTTIAREFYTERKDYIKRLKDMNVFPLSITDQGKTFRRRARLINLSPRFAIMLIHTKYKTMYNG